MLVFKDVLVKNSNNYVTSSEDHRNWGLAVLASTYTYLSLFILISKYQNVE